MALSSSELEAVVTAAVKMWGYTDDAVDYLSEEQQAALSKARLEVTGTDDLR
jgi:hypothetical protein